jgi:hypothetical protein
MEMDIGYNSYGVQWIDFDLDGDLDLSARAWIYRNDNGTFTEVSESIGLTPSQPQNTAWFDYDNDGYLDYFHSVSSASGSDYNELFENQNGTFVNISESVFAVPMQNKYRGLSIGDFDNDGDQDIFLNINENTLDVMLLNEEVEPGVRVFDDVAEFIGITKIGDRKCGSFFDYDRDGFLDIYLTSAEFSHILYHNVTNSNNWVGFILEGTVSNRDAIGTLVKVYSGGKAQIRFTSVPTDYQNQDNPWVHFGIGKDTSIDSVVIRWPLGLKQVLLDVEINQYHEIKEGEVSSVPNSEDENQQPTDFRLSQNYPNPFNSSTQIGYALPSNALVKVAIYDLAGRLVTVLVDGPQPSGFYNISWSGRNINGLSVPSGEYFCKIEADGFSDTIKMILLQ